MDIERISLQDLGLENEAEQAQRLSKVGAVAAATERNLLPRAGTLQLSTGRSTSTQTKEEVEAATLPHGLTEVQRICAWHVL